MKKTLVAMAALAVVGTASAQSSVTVYGTLDTAYSINNGSVSDVSGLSYGNLSSSRVGFRGVEDLGGGLKAAFNLEAGINTSAGDGTDGPSLDNVAGAVGAGALTFGRRATVSILGGFGEVRVGRDYTPTYHNEAQFSAHGRNGVGSTLITQVNVVGNTRSRTSNGIQYLLPGNLGGFYGEAMYAFGEQPDNAGTPAGSQEDNGIYVGARLGFKTGPLDLSVSAGNTSINVGTVSNDRSVVNAGITYDFGVVKLFGLYSVQTADNTVGAGFTALTPAATTGAGAGIGNDLEAKAFAIGATVPFGKGSFKFGYSTLELENGQGAGTAPSVDKFAFGYQYDLSRRTALYATYARVKNKDAAAGAGATTGLTAGFGRQRGLGGTAQTSPSSSSTGFDFGIRHNF